MKRGNSATSLYKGISLLTAFSILFGMLFAVGVPPAHACYNWGVGQRVGLKGGAEIRHGSGFGYGVHTIVPHDNWQVDIIGGPRYVDGQEWWDVSRAALDGGGTGWVYIAQAGYDICSDDPDPDPDPGRLVLIQDLSVSDSSPQVNQDVTGSFRVKNVGGQAMTIDYLGIQGRLNGDVNGTARDFHWVENLTLQPGQEYGYSSSRSFDIAGDWRLRPNYRLNGSWRDVPRENGTINEAWITVENESEPDPGQLELVDDLSLQASPSGQWPPEVGDTLTAHIKVRNGGGEELYLERLGVRGRRNGSEYWDIGWWPAPLAPGEVWELDANNDRALIEGNYSFRVSYKDASGWHEIGNELNFSVGTTETPAVCDPDLRMDGEIQVFGSEFEGGTVFLNVLVKNFGSETSPAVHPYIEGHTPDGTLWRTADAEPNTKALQAGERQVFKIEQDLWYGHTGTWETSGVHLWNDATQSYCKPLAPNGYSQQVNFSVNEGTMRSIDIEYLDDSNKAIDVDYQVVETRADGSVVVDLTVRNKTMIPYYWIAGRFGEVDTPTGSISKLSGSSGIVILPKHTVTFEFTRFPADGELKFYFSRWGFNDDQKDLIYTIHGVNLLSTAVLGVYPTGDMFKTIDDLLNGELLLFADALDSSNLAFFAFGTQLAQGDILGMADSLFEIASIHADDLSQASTHLFKQRIPAGAFKALPYLALFFDLPFYYWDLYHAPAVAEVTLTPSPRVASVDESPGAQQPLSSSANQGTIIASSSEQGEAWQPANLVDGNTTTGWATGAEMAAGQWLMFRVANDAPRLLTSIAIHPGPTGGEHAGAALKEFHVDVSMDGEDFTTVLAGSFAYEELGQVKQFAVNPVMAEYVRLVLDSNQSENAVSYVNVGEVVLSGVPFGSADTMEPDRDQEMATVHGISGSNYDHNFHYPGDVDWLTFPVKEGHRYRVQTSNLGSNADTVIDVYASDGTTLLAGNDDWRGQRASQLVVKAQESGMYFARISQWHPDAYGDDATYEVAVTEVHASFLPVINGGTGSGWAKNRAPGEPVTGTPTDGDQVEGSSVTLRWEGGDPDGDQVIYDVYMERARSAPGLLQCHNAGSRSCTVNGLQAGETYYWQVAARDERGAKVLGPVWSFTVGPAEPLPDEISFVSEADGDYDIYRMNIDGTGLRNISNTSSSEYGVSWSPDGSRLVFHSDRVGHDQLYVMNADGSNQERLLSSGSLDGWPQWSPNGNKIAFGRVMDHEGEGIVHSEVFVVDADGTNVQRLTYTPFEASSVYNGCWPSGWSPDGAEILFYCLGDGTDHMGIMKADGSNRRLIRDDGQPNSVPTMSPDGTKIAFSSRRNGNGDVYLINADGTGLQRLTEDAAYEWRPTWSSDGQKILFESDRDDWTTQIYWMNPDGSGQTRLTDNSSYAGQQSWRP